MTSADVVKIAGEGNLSLKTAVQAIQAGSPATQEYRNAFVAAQMAAIDSRYYEFRRKLSAQSKSANFGLELGVLGLTGVGSVVTTPLANILSAGGAGLTGAKGALAKEVYLDRTVPALLASIDAHRIEARAPLILGLGKDIAGYPLAQAIADLSAYQNAASLDGAIERITAAAAQEKAAAEAKYENVVVGCSRPERDVGDDFDTLEDGFDALRYPADAQKLKAAQAIVGTRVVTLADPAAAFAAQSEAIVDDIRGKFCTRAQAQGLIGKLTTQAGMTFR